MFKKFLCGVAVATMMVSCGGSTSSDNAQDSTATDSAKVEAAAPAAAGFEYEKTGNELLDSGLEMLAKIVDEYDNAKTVAEKQAIFEKFGTEFGKWGEANAEAAEKISDPTLQEKFMKATEKMTTHMTEGIMGDVNNLLEATSEEAK